MLSPIKMLSEISGCLGDLATLIPILVSLSKFGQTSLSASLVFGGIFNILTGVIYDIPMCVQPMKAIAAQALASHLNQKEIGSAGLFVSSIVLLLGVTNLIQVVNQKIPLSIIRGIQLGAGLTLITKGIDTIMKSHQFEFVDLRWMDNFLVAFLAFVFTIYFNRSEFNPTALVLFGIALIFAGVQLNSTKQGSLVFGTSFPAPSSLVPSGREFANGVLSAGLGQLPLTLLNSVIATSKLADDLYPDRVRPVASVRSVSICVGLMNLLGVWFGSMPFCHGSGGLAAQYRFGARSGVSMYVLGSLKIVLGLTLGSSLVLLIQYLPNSILGMMLCIAGLELSLCARDLGPKLTVNQNSDDELADKYLIMLATASSIIGFKNDGIGFVVGCLTAFLIRIQRHGVSSLVIRSDRKDAVDETC